MRTAFSSIKKYLLFASLVFGFYSAQAQVNYNAISFRIDSLANVGLPKSALKEVDKLDELAHKNNNAPQQIRATIYRMTFQSYLEEEALNAIIARLKTDIGGAVYPVKPVLQSLLAEMYWKYYQENRWKFNQRTMLAKPGTDITKWGLQTVINETGHMYELSLADAAKEQHTSVGVLDGVLEGDSSTRYLRPTLYDLLVQRAFDFFLGDDASINKPRLPFSVNDPRYFSDSRTFAGLTVKTTDTASIAYKGIKYLQQATLFHLEQPNEEALADLDLQRLKFLFGKSTADYRDSLYLAALRHIEKTFSSKPISSEALVLEGQYYLRQDSLVTAFNLFSTAARTWPKSLGGKNAAILLKQLEEKSLAATVENMNIPGRPLLALLTYKNLSSAKIAIYKLSEQQFRVYTDVGKSEYASEFFKKYAPVQTNVLNWDTVMDYQTHTLEFKIDPLGPGNYVLMLKGPSKSDSLTEVTDFKVTRLVDINRRNPDGTVDLLVTDRETGEPLKGVKVETEDTLSGKTNLNGILKLQDVSRYDFSMQLSLKGDTLSRDRVYIEGAEQEVDDEPQNKTILFTDRQIYRPGQTIWFKALQLQTFKRTNKILPHTEVDFELTELNGKSIGTLDLKTNEFGTAAGSFIIPQTGLNGVLILKTAAGSLVVRVEEYKRPSFQVEFLPVKGSYKLNDSVRLAGNVTAFSGYGLSQARVAYHIIRSGRFTYNYRKFRPGQYSNHRDNDPQEEIKTDTIITDDQGRFHLSFKATPGNPNRREDVVYNYQVSADITDESGETHSGKATVFVGNKDLKIDRDFPPQMFAGDSLRALLSILNLNDQPQNGRIKVEVFALKDPGRVFKARIWEQQPEQFDENSDDFKNDFPGYGYKNEDQPSTWPVSKKVFSSDIPVDTSSAAVVDLTVLGAQPSGLYRVIIHARNEKGDTISKISYVDIINGRPKPTSFQDWVLPKTNVVRAGDSASFFVGINHRINVLMERYTGSHLISSKWMKIDTGVQKIEIPIADTDADAAVQFTMIYQNRAYNSYQKIYLSRPDKALDLKFITFHDKLQPGQKEQWKLQLTAPGSKMPDAELLAAMYDASLDEISRPEIWQESLDEGHHNGPNYFVWNTWEFVEPKETDDVDYVSHDYGLLSRVYEQLSLLGYAYYGGDNFNYREYQEEIAENAKIAAGKPIGKGGRQIKGTVIAMDDGLPIPGVSVKIMGTSRGVQTGTNGKFTIWVPENGTLVVSFIGFVTRNIQRFPPGYMILKLKTANLALGEVVVTGALGIKRNPRELGYSTQYKRSINGAVSAVDAKKLPAAMSNRMLQGQAAGVTIVNGSPGASTQVSLRGNRLLISDSTPIIPLRTNFNETAFFYPQLHTDENGQILIDFTIPEALTRWRFRALAHTKDLATGYIEREIVTQKELSISANTPRFLREGDTITISARLANLTAGPLKGKVQLRLFNAVNMQPVNLLVNAGDAEQDFDVAGNTNKAVSFRLAIPAGLDALDYKLTADAGTYSDGEENTLPVLPNRMLVTESMPMLVRPGQTRDFTFDKLVNQNSKTLKNKSLTLEYTANPAWYAVQALPYMMEFPYECSEQVFSRYFANSLATNIVTKMPAIKQVFDQWKAPNSGELLSNLEKNQELKSTLIEETPWLRDAENETEQKKRVALLFDLNQMSNELQLNLDKLQKRQLPNGGFTWFGGDYPDRYITQHIAEGMGELIHLGIGKDNSELGQIADKAINYLDDQLAADEKARKKEKQAEWSYGDLEIHAWFTRSFFLDKPLGKPLEAARDGYLKWAEGAWKFRNVYEQGMIALTMQRYGKPAVTAQIERSLLETAQQSDGLGMYWAKNQLGYYWYESPVETQSLLIDLFTEAGDNAKAVEEMKIWLLRNKQTNDWKTTKATAAACYALLLKGSNLLADSGSTKIKLGSKALDELKPDVKTDAGTGYLKTSWIDEQVKPALGKVEISNHGSNIGWGALHWQYLENLDKITSAQTNIHLERKYFIQKQTDAGPLLTAVDAMHQPKTGDLLKVVVYLTADRDFEYVQLKDMRPAGTEPVDALSTYKYQDGLYYYQVTKDVATNFFISELNKGSYVFEYRLRVVQPGNFSTGITSIQCMYAPEYNAHSEGSRMEVR